MLEVAPFPPRYWWLKRISLGVLIVLISLTIFRFAVGVYAQRRFDAHVAELRARGEPTRPEDLAAGEIKDEENAAFYLMRGADAVVATGVDSPRNSNLEYAEYLPYPPEWWQAAKTSMQANRKGIADARIARRQTKSAFPRITTSPMSFGMLKWWSHQRQLANTIADAAAVMHLIGDDAEALELAKDGLFQADAISAEPFVISHLVGVGVQTLVTNNLTIHAPGISMTDAQRGLSSPSKRAGRVQIQELIFQLLKSDRAHVENMFRTERVVFIDSIPVHLKPRTITAPAFFLQYQKGLPYFDDLIAASTAASWPAARKSLDRNTSERAAIDPGGFPNQFSPSNVMRGMDRAMETTLRGSILTRMAAVSLAAQLFRLDHERWPTTLDELVPGYLPKVPLDPMASDGGPLRYLLAGDRPVVYCAGEDGAFSPDPAAHLPATPNYGWRSYSSRDQHKDDQYIDLSRFTPPPAATQSVEQ